MGILSLKDIPAHGIAGVVLLTVILILVLNIVHNLFFHPLYRFPGPLAWRSTRLVYFHRMIRGTLPFDIAALHRRYGPVVRVAPNELAFAHARAWKELMPGGRDELPKWAAAIRPIELTPPNIQNSTDKEEHALLRRCMAPGFADRALRKQEGIVKKYADLLMARLREEVQRGRDYRGMQNNMNGDSEPKGEDQKVDLMRWFNFITFDIIGDLALGASFDCLAERRYHPWILAIQSGGLALCYMSALGMMPLLKKIANVATRNALKRRFAPHTQYGLELVRRRAEAMGERSDLVEPLLERMHDGVLTESQVVANTRALVAAGSETTANNITAAVYFTLSNPHTMTRLKKEVRSAFMTEGDICMSTVTALPYLDAVLNESFRLYPAVAFGMQRVVDRDGYLINGQLIPKDTIVSIQPWAMYSSSQNFALPAEFHPERWLGEDDRFAEDKLEVLKPFHQGSRDCIGKNLGWFEMRLILARFVFNFDAHLAADSRNWRAPQKSYFLIWDKGPMNVRLTLAGC